MDVNNNVDTQINFSQLEDFFKLNNEGNTNASVTTKTKTITVSCKFVLIVKTSLKYTYRFYLVIDLLL